MKKNFLFLSIAITLFVSSCSSLKVISKSALPFPGMTVSRSDYHLSKDVSADVEVKEFTTLCGMIRGAKTIGESKKTTKKGLVSGYGLDKASEIAAYRLLENNPQFDYLTNIRIQREYTKKWYFLFTKYTTTVKITAKGITLNTDK